MKNRPAVHFVGDQKQNFLSILKELSLVEEQERLWLSDGSSGQVSSFGEAFEGLFTDIDIYEIANSGALGEPKPMVAHLQELEELLRQINYRLSDAEKIAHPKMIPVRKKATEILNFLPNSFFGDGDD